MASFVSRERATRFFGELADRRFSVALHSSPGRDDKYPRRYFLQVDEMWGWKSSHDDNMTKLLEFCNQNNLEWEVKSNERPRTAVSGLVIHIGDKSDIR